MEEMLVSNFRAPESLQYLNLKYHRRNIYLWEVTVFNLQFDDLFSLLSHKQPKQME